MALTPLQGRQATSDTFFQVPTTQGTQDSCVAPASLISPHSVHETEPAEETLPVGHARQVTLPSDANWPAGQDAHDVLSLTGIVPARQATHTPLLATMAFGHSWHAFASTGTLPTEHAVHDASPGTRDTSPVGHARQVLAPVLE